MHGSVNSGSSSSVSWYALMHRRCVVGNGLTHLQPDQVGRHAMKDHALRAEQARKPFNQLTQLQVQLRRENSDSEVSVTLKRSVLDRRWTGSDTVLVAFTSPTYELLLSKR